MRHLIAVILGIMLLLGSSYSYATPVVVDFTGHLAMWGPDPPGFSGSIVRGRFAYDSDAAGTVTKYGKEWPGYGVFVSIDDKYNYASASSTIFIDLSAMYDVVGVYTYLTPLGNYSLGTPLFLLRVSPKNSSDNTPLLLPKNWDASVWRHGLDIPEVMVIDTDLARPYLGYDIDTITSFSTPSHSAPVPEPSTFLLLGAGLAGIGFMRRKANA